MTNDFYRPTSTHIQKVKDVPRVKGIRIYRASPEPSWDLQVRGPMGVGPAGYGEGKDFIVATAALNTETLRALYEQIGRLLDSETA